VEHDHNRLINRKARSAEYFIGYDLRILKEFDDIFTERNISKRCVIVITIKVQKYFIFMKLPKIAIFAEIFVDINKY
jgi:hypothetical protein